MPKLQDGDEVAVYAEDGRRSDLATFHGWERRGEEWWAHVMVYGPYQPNVGSGMHRDTVHAARVQPLIYCPWNPIERQAYHRCEREHQVWA